MTDTSPTPADRPADQLRAAAEKLRAARFSGAITATPIVAALIGARMPLAAWLDAEAVPPITAQHSDRCTDPQCTTLAALAVARQLLGTTSETTADEEREPIQLRWGLDDVTYGDDDTTTVLLSGPGGEPYWVELDPERTAALRDALAGPESTAQPAPADQAAFEALAAEWEQRGEHGDSSITDRARELRAVLAAAPQSARRRLTPTEHDRAWHAIEGTAGEDDADPGTVLNAVLHALRIDAPTAAEEQAASPRRRLAGEAAAGAHHPTEARTRIADALAAADGWEWAPSFDKTRSPSYQEFLRQADVALAALATPAVPAAPEETR